LFQQRGLGRMLGAYANTAEWTGFTLKDYNADSETFAVASAAFPTVSYRVKISPREAEAFRGNFGKAVYGTPVFGYSEGSILLDNVGISVAVAGATRQLSIVRQPGVAAAPASAAPRTATATTSTR